jgi:hypothetical protein
MHKIRVDFTQRRDPNEYWLAQRIVSFAETADPALAWFTTTGVWSSRENLHLYYRLRQSYGDLRLLDEAPGHLCLGYERADLTTWVFLGY